MPDAGLSTCPSHRRRLGNLPFYREVLPEVGYAIRAVRTSECRVEARRIIGVACDDFRAEAAERPSFFRLGFARNRTRSKWTRAIGENRADEPSTLRTRGSHNRDDLLLRHVALLYESKSTRATREDAGPPPPLRPQCRARRVRRSPWRAR
jgi:hypothetical protein